MMTESGAVLKQHLAKQSSLAGADSAGLTVSEALLSTLTGGVKSTLA